MDVPALVWEQLERDLPGVLHDVAIVRMYNRITGAHLTHFDFAALGVLDRDEVLTVVDSVEIFQ